MVLGAALLWSTGGLFIKWNDLSAFELSCGRSLFAAVTVMLLTRREGFGINLITGVAAVLYAVLLLLFVVATKLTTAANAIFLQYTAPVYILLLEPVLFKEKYRGQDFVTVAVCLGGMSLFFVGRLRPDDVKGTLAALGSGLCFAFFFLLLRHRRAREVNRASAVIYGSWLLALVTAVALFAAPEQTRGGAELTARNFAVMAYLGVFQIGLAYSLLTAGVARGVKSLDAGIIGYIEPVLNPVWVFLVLGERPSQYALLGGAIIIAAVVAHTLWEAKRRRTKGT